MNTQRAKECITVIENETDGSIVYKQFEVEEDRNVSFGPLSTTLFDLIDKGAHIQAVPTHRAKRFPDKKVTLYLVIEGVCYKVASVPYNLILHSTNLETFLPKRLSFAVYSEKNKITPEAFTSYALKKLVEAFPVKKKKTPRMIGNRTLREFVLEQLRE